MHISFEFIFEFVYIEIVIQPLLATGIYNSIMTLNRVRINLQCIFQIKKRIKLVNTNRLSDHIDISDETKFSIFFFGGEDWGVKKYFFYYSMM